MLYEEVDLVVDTPVKYEEAQKNGLHGKKYKLSRSFKRRLDKNERNIK